MLIYKEMIDKVRVNVCQQSRIILIFSYGFKGQGKPRETCILLPKIANIFLFICLSLSVTVGLSDRLPVFLSVGVSCLLICVISFCFPYKLHSTVLSYSNQTTTTTTTTIFSSKCTSSFNQN